MEVAEAVHAHLRATGHHRIEVEVRDHYPWAKSPADNPVARAMHASYDDLGLSFLPYPLAPWCAPYFVLDRILELPWACGGAGDRVGAFPASGNRR